MSEVHELKVNIAKGGKDMLIPTGNLVGLEQFSNIAMPRM